MNQDELLEATHPGTNHEITKRLIAEREEVLDFNADDDYDVAFPEIEEAGEALDLRKWKIDKKLVASKIAETGEGWLGDAQLVENVLGEAIGITKFEDRYEIKCALSFDPSTFIIFSVSDD